MPTTIATDDRKPIPAIPPLNRKKEIPKYKIGRETLPAPKARFRFEPPFAQIATPRRGNMARKFGRQDR
jgi:hypothetical protein